MVRRAWMGILLCLLLGVTLAGLAPDGVGSQAMATVLTPSGYGYLPLVERPWPTATPTPTPTPTPTSTPAPGPAWLSYVNLFRLESGVAQLTENPAWSSGGVLHSRYMVKTDTITHSEDPGNPWYTQDGYDAGRNGNIAVSSWSGAADTFAIDLWMTGPFHAISMLDPELAQTGFGSYREDLGTWRMGATLDVLRGRGPLPPGTTFPITFPGEGGQTWLRQYNGNEWPDPLTGCPGYSSPSGPPIMIQLGSGNLTPQVTASSFRRGATELAHCTFDETNFSGESQSTARLILNNRDAVVIMPREPLSLGETYTAAVTANGQTTTWQFTVVSPPGRGRPAPDGAARGSAPPPDPGLP